MKKMRRYVLQTGCVLMILGAWLRFLMSITYLNLFSKAKLAGAEDQLSWPLIYTMVAFAAASVILMMAVGIMGIPAVDDPPRAKKCLVWGLITLASNTIANVSQTMLNYSSDILWVVGTAAPLIFVIGAFLRRKK